jgi:hypothetical protein
LSTVFPLDPEINDEYLGYRFDGTSWKIIGLRLTKPEGYTLSNATATIFDSSSEEELSTIGRFPGLPYQIKVYADTDSYSYQIGDFVKVVNTYDAEDVNPTLSASATSVDALDSSIYNGNATFSLSEPITAYSGQYIVATELNNPGWIQLCQIITISGTEVSVSYTTLYLPESPPTSSSEWIVQRDTDTYFNSPLPQYYQNGRSVSGTIIEINPTNYVINIQQSSSYIWESDTCTVSLAGLPGADGPTGSTGSAGADGANGANGIDGDNGDNGIDGISAYEAWLNLGYYGSEQDFIDSLRGQDGVPGMDGQDGAPGQDGQDGANGLGYKVRAIRGGGGGGGGNPNINWTFEETNAYQVGNRIRISDGSGSFEEGDILYIDGLYLELNVESSSGTLAYDTYYSVTVVGKPGLNGGGGGAGLGYKVRAEIDDSVAAATGISSWIFEEYSAYQNGNRVRISAEDGSFQEGTISDISGLSFQLNIESSNGTLGTGYYPVTIVGNPGLNGEPGIGYSSIEGKVPNNLVLSTVSTDGNSSFTFNFPSKLAYQIGNRVRISQVSNLSNYVEGSITTINVTASATGVAPNVTYSYVTTIGISFDAKGGSGTWTANSTLLSIGLSISNITGNLTVGESITKTTSTELTSSAATTIATFSVPSLSCIAVECVVLISSSSNGGYTTSKVLITGGAGNVDITEYAIIQKASASTLLNPTLSATISGNTISLRAAVSSFTNVTAKVISTSILSPMGAA